MLTPVELRQVIARLAMLNSPAAAELEALRSARLLLAIQVEGPAN